VQVLVHLDRTEIPGGNVHPRWTREAGAATNSAAELSVIEQMTAQNDELKRRVLVMKALELSQSKGPIDDEAYADALRAMQNIVPSTQGDIYPNISPCGEVGRSIWEETNVTESIACPERVKRAGRPRDTSLKSWKKHYKLEKENKRNEDKDIEGPDERKQGARPAKTRRVTDLMQVT
jgi:hypothetical protein